MFFRNKKNIGRVLASLLCVVLVSGGNYVTSATGLIGAHDYISSDVLSADNVEHNVSFVLPLDSHEITPTDYIRITFPNFSNVTAPTSGSGWVGAPVFGVDGNTALVTNVSVPLGRGIGISGITATNPSTLSEFEVVIDIASDASGTVIYDSVVLQAVVSKGMSTASVTIPSTNAAIELAGFTSPNAFVTIKLGGAVAATLTADSNGEFSKILTGLEENLNYNVEVYAQDIDFIQSNSVILDVYTLPYTTHTISNIVIPPTIVLDKDNYLRGETLIASGYGNPFSQMSVFIDSGVLYSDVVQTGSDGKWMYTFDTNLLVDGIHTIKIKEIVNAGFSSELSETVGFEVYTKNTKKKKKSEEGLNCRVADLNCDKYVDFTDFSILMYYFGDTSMKLDKADIDGNGIVDKYDLDILLKERDD